MKRIISSETSPTNTKKLPNHVLPSKNSNLDSTDMTDLSDSYERRVAHAGSVKVFNNRYSTPVTPKFTTVPKERIVNITQKHVIIFTTIKLFDLSATIKSQKDIVYINPNASLVAKHIKMYLT